MTEENKTLEKTIVDIYSPMCYDYTTALWFDDILYEDWPNVAMILTDEQYESSKFKEKCFVAGFFCSDNQIYVLKDCNEGDYKAIPLSKCNPEFQKLLLEYISDKDNLEKYIECPHCKRTNVIKVSSSNKYGDSKYCQCLECGICFPLN